MSEEAKNGNEVIVDPNEPGKVVVEIDPISIPLEYAEEVGKIVIDATKAVEKEIDHMAKKIKKLFKF